MKRPNWLLFVTLGFLIKIYGFLKGQRIISNIRIKGPAIVLSNHTSFYDFVYTTAAIYPSRVNYMAASKMFYEPFLGFFLRLVRAFPKCLFQSDPVSTMNIFRLLKQNGVVSIFPEGQISPIGVTQELSFSIAKLLKKAKVSVYLVKHHNAYLVNPPWTKKTFKGRIETSMKLIIPRSDLLTMSERDIYDLIVHEMAFNVSEFNQNHLYRYKVNDITNLESVIYQCPSCGFEGLTSNHHHLQCPRCKSIFEYDEFGKISSFRLDELYLRQVNTMKEKIDSNELFCIESDVRLESYRNNLVKDVGEGHLTLTKNAYKYEGTIDGINKTLTFDPKNIPSLPSDLGRNVQIYEGYFIYQFVFKDVKMPTMFVIASEYIHKLHINSINLEEEHQ